MTSPLRLRLDSAALVANWRALAGMSGAAACGAAVKANGYGLGAREVVRRLADAGCRDFFVATWTEAREIADLAPSVAVLHGVRREDMASDRPANARPVLNSQIQVRLWLAWGEGAACDVMVDTGMNRLGIAPEDVSSLGGLNVDTLMSHLACADEDVAMNARQRDAFAALAGRTGAARMSLANSAGIALGADYHFDLTRPGISLYGGVQVAGHRGRIAQVVTPEAQIVQRRGVPAGEAIGYNATFVAPADMEVAILNLGYADGYLRCFSGKGSARVGGVALPLLGRVSMDLIAVDVSAMPGLGEGDWVSIDYALPETSAMSGLSQYELLTGLGRRFDRVWG